jgi:hypothetical protein
LRGQNAFLWCNLLFVVLGWTFFARAARLGWKRQLAFAAALAAMNAPIRYVFSAMQEPLHYALMLAVLGCGILARRDKSRAAWAGLCVLCAVATLVRPYEAVLWLFPLALCRQDRRRIAVCVAGGAVSLGGTLVLMSKFYAPYFFTNVDLSPLQELAQAYDQARQDPAFQLAYDRDLAHYVGRPSPLFLASRITEELGGARQMPGGRRMRVELQQQLGPFGVVAGLVAPGTVDVGLVVQVVFPIDRPVLVVVLPDQVLAERRLAAGDGGAGGAGLRDAGFPAWIKASCTA